MPNIAFVIFAIGGIKCIAAVVDSLVKIILEFLSFDHVVRQILSL
jgi:hypothetical protein